MLFSKLLSLARYIEKLGENDPETLTTMSNLAVVYCNQGKYNDAEALLKQCFDKVK